MNETNLELYELLIKDLPTDTDPIATIVYQADTGSIMEDGNNE